MREVTVFPKWKKNGLWSHLHQTNHINKICEQRLISFSCHLQNRGCPPVQVRGERAQTNTDPESTAQDYTEGLPRRHWPLRFVQKDHRDVYHCHITQFFRRCLGFFKLIRAGIQYRISYKLFLHFLEARTILCHYSIASKFFDL